MKKLLILLLFIPLVSFGQKLNKESNGYFEVVELKLSEKEIKQKINEWIDLKSSVEINNLETIITSGNFTIEFDLPGGLASIDYYFQNKLIFYIENNKYKIELKPTNYSAVRLRYNNIVENIDNDENHTVLPDGLKVSDYMMLKNLSKETFAKNREDFVRKNLSRQGLNESTVKFMLTKEKIDESYEYYLISKNKWDESISRLFLDIKSHINLAVMLKKFN